MPLRDRLRLDALKLLYEKGESYISTIAEILNVRWETAQKLVDELSKDNYVIKIKKTNFPFNWVVTLTEKGRKHAYKLFSADADKLGKAEVLLLLIIYVIDGVVKGATKLEKLPFLLEREMRVSLKDVFKYVPYLHGPYSGGAITESMRKLEHYGFVNMKERVVDVSGDKEGVMRIYELTQKGKDLAKDFFNKLPGELKDRFASLRPYAKMPVEELKIHVYSKYPEFKKYTKLDEFK